MPPDKVGTAKEQQPPPLPTICACQGATPPQPSMAPKKVNRVVYFSLGTVGLGLWWAAYISIAPLSQWLVHNLFSIGRGTPTGDALAFFFYDTAKILLLLLLMVYAVAWMRAGVRIERAREYLAGQGRGIGYFLGAIFGAITPFCSCSSVPLFLGFTMARIPLGITMAFLITSPLINEIAVVLLWGLLGWQFTLIYVLTGLFAGVLGGLVMDAIRARRWLQPFLLNAMANDPRHSIHEDENSKTGLEERHRFAWAETGAIFRRVWPWVIIGVGLGALLHGFVPERWFAEHLGAGQWWSVPVAVAVGIPLYTNVTGIVPVMESLLLKGLPLGTTLAFCMSMVAASLPEALMLKQVMRWQLLAIFLGLLLIIFILVGWLFNLLQTQIL